MKKIHKLKRKDSFIEVKKRNLRSSAANLDEWFDEAVEPRVVEISKKLDDLQNKIHELNESLTFEMVDIYGRPIENDEENGRPCDHDLQIFEDLGGIDYDMHVLEEQQLSIASMRLVYLFKNFEILLKDIIGECFQNVNKRELFQWENVKTFLNSFGVKFGEIAEYQRINELRVVNNNIKHSNEIDESTKKQNIPEFKDKDYFDFESLNSFYLRLKNKPALFLNNMAEELISYLYVYDDERIKNIVKDFGERMDATAGNKLISELNKLFT